MQSIWNWLLAGAVPHWVWIAFSVYELGNTLLPKTSKYRANGTVEAIFNVANKVLLPIFGKFPVLGPLLHTLDTPELPGTVTTTLPPNAAWLIRPLALACVSCATPYGQAYTACIAQKGIQVATSVPGQVETVIAAGATQAAILTGLIGLAGTAGYDAVACAVESWQTTHPVPAHASPDPHLLIAHAAIHDFLSQGGK